MPSPITITGKPTPTWHRREIRFSPFSGDETIYEVQGPKDGMMPLIAELKTQGFAGTCIEDQSPLAKITYQIPKLDDPGGGGNQPEIPIPIWELFSNAKEIDILESEVAINLTDEERRKIRDAINSPTEGKSPALTTPLAINIYLLMLKGVKSRRVDVYTLRQTRTVSTAWPIYNAILNNGRIFTSARVRSDEALPAQYALPDFETDDDDFVYGWRKNFPQVQQTGFNKFNLSQEWEYGKWVILLEGAILA